MSNVLKDISGRRLSALFVAGILAGGLVLAVPGFVFASEYEVRMPVEKTARISPVGELPAAEAKSAKAGKSDKPDADKAPKTALGRAAEAAAASEKSAEKAASKKTAVPAPKPTVEPKSAKPQAASNLVVPTGTPVPVAVPPAPTEATPQPVPAAHAAPAVMKVKKTPPPPPAPKLDPKALVMPKTPENAADGAQGQTAIALPADGMWVGELHVNFEEQRVIVHAATNRAVERVTWFNQAEPRKLATDLRGEWHKKGSRVLRFDTGPVKNIIVGEHPDRLRLSVEFRDGAVKADFEPEVKTGPEGVTVSIPLAISLKN